MTRAFIQCHMLTNLHPSELDGAVAALDETLTAALQRFAKEVARSGVSAAPNENVIVYGCKEISDRFTSVLQSAPWLVVVEVADESAASIKIIAFRRRFDSSGTVQLVSLCQYCSIQFRICTHALKTLASLQHLLTPESTVEPFVGLFSSDDWGWNDHDVREIPEYLSAHDRASSVGSYLTLAKVFDTGSGWQDGSKLVLQLSNVQRSRLGDGQSKTVVSLRILTKDCRLLLAEAIPLNAPGCELEWYAKYDSMPAANDGSGRRIESLGDAYHLTQFAKQERLLNSRGQLVYYDQAAEAMYRWYPNDDDSQTLVCLMNEPKDWLFPDGPVFCPHANTITQPSIPRRVVDLMERLPSIDAEQSKNVATHWKHHPVLGTIYLPLPLAERVITDIPTTLVGRAETSIKRPGIETPISGVFVVIERYAGSTPVSVDIKNGHLEHKEGNNWNRYHISTDHSTLVESLNLLGFIRLSDIDGAFVLQAPIGASIEDVYLAISLDEGWDWFAMPNGVNTRLVDSKGPLTLTFNAAVKKLSNGSEKYELVIDCRGGDEKVEIAGLHNSHFLQDRLAHKLWSDRYGRRLPEGVLLLGISKGVYAFVDNRSLQECLSKASILIDHATRVGSSLILSSGALLRLATLDDDLLESGAEIERARTVVKELLDAQTVGDEREIKGINGITFSPNQAAGVNWLVALYKNRLGGVLADERGAGKTFQVLGAVAETRKIRKRLKKGPALILMELRELDHWTGKHLGEHAKGLKWSVFHGLRKPDVDVLREQDVVVTTYGMVPRNEELFRSLDPGFIFADEAKRLKNKSTKTWGVINSIEGASVVSINGTPLTRNVADIWSGINLAVPGFLGSYTGFTRRYKAHIEEDPAFLDRLRKAMAPIFIRRPKDSPSGTPNKQLIQQVVTMEPRQAEAYTLARARVLEDLQQLRDADVPTPQIRFKLSTMLERLRAITATPGNVRQLSSKGEALRDMVGEFVDDGRRVLVFSHNNTFVDSIAEILRKQGIPTSVFKGSNASHRNKEKQLFIDGHSRVLVLSGYGGKGLDLPQATRVIITDPWIDADEDDQMADRALRFISKEDIEVFHLIASGTLEEGAMVLLDRHREMQQAILDGAPAPDPKLMKANTLDDYLYLLEFEPNVRN